MGGISYLKGLPWNSWTRDERFFCSVLYKHAILDPAGFADWLIRTAAINTAGSSEWDLGFEVAFYRDFLWHKPGATARQSGLPSKRTFDLCLFGDRDIVVIEAKVCEAFKRSQNDDFAQDATRINGIPGLADVRVQVIALASSKYFSNASKYGRDATLSLFQGRISWADAANRYKDSLLTQADAMYKAKPGNTLGQPV